MQKRILILLSVIALVFGCSKHSQSARITPEESDPTWVASYLEQERRRVINETGYGTFDVPTKKEYYILRSPAKEKQVMRGPNFFVNQKSLWTLDDEVHVYHLSWDRGGKGNEVRLGFRRAYNPLAKTEKPMWDVYTEKDMDLRKP